MWSLANPRLKEFLQDEAVHDRGAAHDGNRFLRVERGPVEKARHHADVLFPDPLVIPVDTVQIPDILPVEKSEQLIFEQDIVGIVRPVHQDDFIEFIPFVERIQKQGAQGGKPEAAGDQQELSPPQLLQRKSAAVGAANVE